MIIKAINLYTSNNDIISIPYKNLIRNPSCSLSKTEKGKIDCFSLDFKFDTNIFFGEKLQDEADVNALVERFEKYPDIVGIEFETNNKRMYGDLPWVDNGKKGNSLQIFKKIDNGAYRLKIASR